MRYSRSSYITCTCRYKALKSSSPSSSSSSSHPTTTATIYEALWPVGDPVEQQQPVLAAAWTALMAVSAFVLVLRNALLRCM